MSETKWSTDEEVLFQRPRGFPYEPIPPAGNCVRVIVKGTVEDGRRFYWEQWITEEFLADQGEAQVAQMMRRAAHPPEDFYA